MEGKDRPARRYREIAAKLRDLIEAGHYNASGKLPPERELAERFGVSRPTIREALLALEIGGFVDVKVGSGVYLRSPALRDTSVERDPVASHDTEDARDVGSFELLQARQLVESSVAGLAASRVTRRAIGRMREALALERELIANGSSDHTGDEQFHLLIAEAAENVVLYEVVRDLWDRRNRSPLWRKLHSHIFDGDYRYRWLADHEKILKAMVMRDGEGAYRAMWDHLENVRQTLLIFSDPDDPSFDGYLFDAPPLSSVGDIKEG